MENNVRPNSIRAWILAARPKTLTGAATPVMVGGAIAAADISAIDGEFMWVPFVLCMLFAWLMQIAANFVNDWYDFKKGTDTEERLGPKRACAQGWITLPAMRRATAVVMLLASLIGLPLIIYGGWNMIWVGVACLLFCVLYTTVFSYLGLGDLLVIMFFGIVPVSVTYFLLTGTVTSSVAYASVATGVVVDCLLIVNNFRDRDTDKATGKKTIAVRLGARFTLTLYLFCGIFALLLLFPLAAQGHFILPLVMIPYMLLHISTWREMRRIDHGRELNVVLALTSRNIFVFGLSVVVGMLVALCGI